MLTQRLLKQGYRYDHLCSTFKRFIITYKQHKKDGVGLPLNVIHGSAAVSFVFYCFGFHCFCIGPFGLFNFTGPFNFCSNF